MTTKKRPNAATKKAVRLDMNAPARVQASKILKQGAERTNFDAYFNSLTGLGTKEQDKRLSAEVEWAPKPAPDCETLYAGSDVARRIVDKPVDTALQAGWEWLGVPKAKAKWLDDRWDELRCDQAIDRAWKQARTTGGAIIALVPQDVGSIGDPAREGEQIIAVTVADRGEIMSTTDDIQRDILRPGYGFQEWYAIYSASSIGGERNLTIDVHASRAIRFDGAWLPDRLFRLNNYWHDSILNAIEGSIRDYDQSFQSAAAVIKDFSVGLFKLKGLADLVSDDDRSALINRLMVISMAKAVTKTITVDADGEDFTHQSRTVTGLTELLEKVEDRLVAATDYPRTVLLGQSPKGGGLNEKGGHETDNWGKYIVSQQENVAKPRILQLARAICVEGGIDPAKLDLRFHPLQVPSDAENADLALKLAAADEKWLANGVLDAVEVAKSRWNKDGTLSTRTLVDLALREEGQRMDPEEVAAKEAEAKAVAEQQNEGDPNAEADEA